MSTYTSTENRMDGETTVDKAQDMAVKAGEKVSETASVAKEQAKRTAAQVGEQAKSTVDSRMSDVAGELGSVAEAVRQTTYEIGGESQTVARYGERIAEQLEGVSSYLNEKGIEDVLGDLEGFARRQPAVFLGGAFMLGMVVGRFIRSSGNNAMGMAQGQTDGYGYGTDYSPRISTTGYDTSYGSNRYQSGLDQQSTTFQE